jgi:HEPN domain
LKRASNQLNAAKEHVKTASQHSEVIQAAQQCVALSVKSILSLLGVHYCRSHARVAINRPEIKNVTVLPANRVVNSGSRKVGRTGNDSGIIDPDCLRVVSPESGQSRPQSAVVCCGEGGFECNRDLRQQSAPPLQMN